MNVPLVQESSLAPAVRPTRFKYNASMSAERHKRCPECDYIQIGLTGNRCPRCGRPFDPEDRETLTPDEDPDITSKEMAILVAYVVLTGAAGMIIKRLAGDLPWWVMAAIALAFLNSVTISLLVSGRAGRRLFGDKAPLPEGQRALRTALLVSLSVLLTAALLVLLLIYLPR